MLTAIKKTTHNVVPLFHHADDEEDILLCPGDEFAEPKVLVTFLGESGEIELQVKDDQGEWFTYDMLGWGLQTLDRRNMPETRIVATNGASFRVTDDYEEAPEAGVAFAYPEINFLNIQPTRSYQNGVYVDSRLLGVHENEWYWNNENASGGGASSLQITEDTISNLTNNNFFRVGVDVTLDHVPIGGIIEFHYTVSFTTNTNVLGANVISKIYSVSQEQYDAGGDTISGASTEDSINVLISDGAGVHDYVMTFEKTSTNQKIMRIELELDDRVSFFNKQSTYSNFEFVHVNFPQNQAVVVEDNTPAVVSDKRVFFDDPEDALVQGMVMIPSSGEAVYSTNQALHIDGEDEVLLNVNGASGQVDVVRSVEDMLLAFPYLRSVTIVVSWFGSDIRLGHCTVKPKATTLTGRTYPNDWYVNGVVRGTAEQPTEYNGELAYGGTPSDFSVVELIKFLKSKGLDVCFYPFILMDIPVTNTLPDPFRGGAIGQPSYCWRGYIQAEDDMTAAVQTAADNFFGTVDASDVTISGDRVSYSGPANEWSINRMILHYARLCELAGGVESFIVGSEMIGATQSRSAQTTFPVVDHYNSLIDEVRTIVGDETKISYAADWLEIKPYQPQDGSGDVLFHLDAIWANENCDFIGVDNYNPISDWRDGTSHLDYMAGFESIYDQDYLQSQIEGGEGRDYYYASDSDRDNQVRSPLSEWVYGSKMYREFWGEQHFNRFNYVPQVTPTAWVPQSKPIRFVEYGCAHVDKGTNEPNKFLDPKSFDSALPHFSDGSVDTEIAKAYYIAMNKYWDPDGENNPWSRVYRGHMIDVKHMGAWTWDARPYPAFPDKTDVWSDGTNYPGGHWINGRAWPLEYLQEV